MQTSLCLSLIIAIIRLVSGNSEVMIKNSTYPCCDQPSIQLDKHCGHVIRNNDGTFAKYKDNGLKKGCHPPCKEMQDGRMLLEQCVEVQVSTVCSNERGSVHERRTSFKNIPCSGPVLAPGSVGLLLLLLLLLVFTVDLWTM